MPFMVPARTVPDPVVVRALMLACPTGRPELTDVQLAPMSVERKTWPTKAPAPAYRFVPPEPLGPEARAYIERFAGIPLLLAVQLAPLLADRKMPLPVPTRMSLPPEPFGTARR